MKRLLILLLMLWQVAGAQAPVRVTKFTQSPTGVVAGWRQKVAGVDTGPDSWERIITTQGLNLVAANTALVKPLNRNFSTQVAKLDLSIYARQRPGQWADGFVVTNFYRRLDESLSAQLNYSTLLANKALTDAERTNPANRNIHYFEVSGGMLGAYENPATYVDASIPTLLNHIANNVNPAALNARRVCFNIELTYLPAVINGVDGVTGDEWSNPSACSGCNEDKGVLQFWPDAATRTWVVEAEGDWKGQSKTIQQLFDAGRLTAEIAQRQVNRAVLLVKWYQAVCPAGTLVTIGDGNQVYFNKSVAFEDHYASVKAGTRNSAYTPAFWTLGANFPAQTLNGKTVSGGGSRLWDVQGWVNNYRYVPTFILSAPDFDYIANTANGATYAYMWSKAKPGPDQEDVNIPASFAINRAAMAAYGRPNIPYVWQGHNRAEFGARKEGTETVVQFTNLGPDGSLLPPFLTETYSTVARFAGFPGDGITNWTTIGQGGPGASSEHNTWSNRPLSERMGQTAGLAALSAYGEYFPANPAQVKYLGIDDVYVKYPIAGGNSTGGSEPIIVDGGNGFYKRDAASIVFHTNGSVDPRTKAGVQARVITKNGAKWALLCMTNHRHVSATQSTTLSVRFKAADIGTAADIDVGPFVFSGWYPSIVEVCLQPTLLTLPQLTGVGSTSGGSSPPSFTGVDPDYNYGGFSFQVPPSVTFPDLISVVSGSLRVELKKSYGAGITGVYVGGSGNMINNADHGRQMAPALYADPTPFTPGGIYTKHPTFGQGFALNLNMVGDWANNPSQVLQTGFDPATGTVYTKTRARNFATLNYLTGTIYEQWVTPLPGDKIAVHYRITNNRNDDPAPARELDGSLVRSRGLNQEFPVAYINDSFAQLSFDAGSGTQTRNLNNSGDWLQSWPIVNNWLHVGNGTQGFGWVGPHITAVTGQMHPLGDPSAVGGPDGMRSTYVTNHYAVNMDPVGTLYTSYTLVGGSAATTKAYAESRTDLRLAAPDYSFTQHRRGFSTQNATLNDEATGGELVVTHKNEGARLYSPQRPFQASAVPTLYIRVKNDSPVTGMRLNFRKPGQSELEAAGQITDFTVPNDGQWHTRAINMTAIPGWSGTISYFVIGQNPAPDNSPVSGRTWRFRYIGKTNPTP
ncbi:hypothetical protein F5984_20500 [Rudanella paleaurantiibacter]|uniref:Uncharacterized protein n=1 Tax=Rudanella paleaurantiibacter TaxID=2614655 RepID=A0A7J5TVE9_9BACT|nr:hypothetical protein [Rudanella paleaurantiibacter]KAB7728129.1 hypothetical protein F5984_20500 [Rudanella paleaurantiibacter]